MKWLFTLFSDGKSTLIAELHRELPAYEMSDEPCPLPARYITRQSREQRTPMSNVKARPRVTSFAPQFLVDDLARSMTYYEKLGFIFGEPWDGFYAIGQLDGLELHLKEGPKSEADRQYRREHEHLDAAAGVDGIEAFYDQCVANEVEILRPLMPTAWGTKDFYIEDPDGYVIAFGGRASEQSA